MMTRRTFLCGLTLGVLSAPHAAGAQQAGKVYRIGTLVTSQIDLRGEIFLTFLERLQELGYRESRNLVFEHRGADGRPERLQELAQELIAANVDVIVALLPRAKRILVLWDSTNPPDVVARPGLETAAAQMKTRLEFVEARDAA